MIKISFDDFSKTRTIINQTGHITQSVVCIYL